MADTQDPSKDDKPSFKVTDRRGVEAAPSPAPEPSAEPAHHAPRPPIDFSTFVLSLASTALIQMGATPDPETGKVEKDLEIARETIDLLGLLQEKTRGNLTDEESHFFEAVLYDLRVKFVESQRS